MPEEEGDDYNKRYLALFRRSKSGHMTMVVPTVNRMQDLIQKNGIAYDV